MRLYWVARKRMLSEQKELKKTMETWILIRNVKGTINVFSFLS